MAPECQEKNLKGLTMVAVGVNKSAEQYLLLDDQTRDHPAGPYQGAVHEARTNSASSSSLAVVVSIQCRSASRWNRP